MSKAGDLTSSAEVSSKNESVKLKLSANFGSSSLAPCESVTHVDTPNMVSLTAAVTKDSFLICYTFHSDIACITGAL